MRLSDAAKLEPLSVERDAVFESLGTVVHRQPRMLVFVEEPKYLAAVRANDAIACVIVPPSIAPDVPSGYGLAVAEDARGSFYRLHNRLARETTFYWQDFPTEIDPTASIDEAAYVAPKNVRIGARVRIEPLAAVLERTIIGDDAVLRAGCTIGTQGFEHKRIDGEIFPVEHAGAVRFGNRVEIQANSTVDRSVFGGFTELGDDTKLDNLVHIAHNVVVGRRCLIAASAMIAGTVTMGDDVWIGPNATISSGVAIGNGASVTLGSVVTRDVPDGGRVTGNWAVPHEQFLATLRRSLKGPST